MHHQLDIRQIFFEAILCGKNRFEVRKGGEQEFRKDDTVTFSCPDGRSIDKRITYVLEGDASPLTDFVVFGMEGK